MPNLSIPNEGLVVPGPSLQVPDEKPNARAAYAAPFAVKINVTERFLEELSAGKLNSLQLNTGKGRMSLQVGSNQFEFMHTTELFHNELYRQSSDDSAKVVPMGMLKDKLELLEVGEKKNGVDADLLALKQQMEALQKQKDKKSVQLVSNPSKLGPELSGRRGLIAAKKAGILTPSAMKTKVNSRTKFSDSMPTSPALTATNSPAGKDVTSAPKPKSFRKDPLFLPLIHLLALGPEREQTLAMKTHTDLDKCSGLVIQVANRDISGRWELFDRMYKELDVWKFKYPKQEMRESAIENAEDAFDRLKLPEDAPEWEMLRRPEDRGKPRPPRQPRKKPEPEPPVAKKKPVAATGSPALPPTIKISKDESASSSPALGAEPMARSISQPIGTSTSKRGNAESNALKKIIGNSNKKAPAKAKANSSGGGSGAGGGGAAASVGVPSASSSTAASTIKVAAKKPPTTSTSTTSSSHQHQSSSLPSSSTLNKTTISSKSPLPTSSAPSSSAKSRPSARSRAEYKSAEFISDSDSDDDNKTAIDTPPRKTVPSSASSSASSSSSAQPLYKKSTKAKAAQSDSRPANIPSKRPPGVPISKPEHTPASNVASPATNGHKRTASMSASPAKPSPLGSSPPMTASELARQSSTASSSPLSEIATPDDVSTPMMDLHASYTSAPTHTPKSSTEKASSKPRYVPDQHESPSPQHKRKAEEPPMASYARSRKRVLSATSEESDASKKRKAPDEERPVTARKAPKTSATSEATKARKGPIKTVANGVSKKDFDKVIQTRKDIPRATYASSVASTTSSLSSSSSDSSSRGGYRKPRLPDGDMALLATYKRLHDDYRTKYEKVRADPNAPEERIKKDEADIDKLDLPELPGPPTFPLYEEEQRRINALFSPESSPEPSSLTEEEQRQSNSLFLPEQPSDSEDDQSPEPPSSIEEEEDDYLHAKEERERHERLVRELNFTPSPEPEEEDDYLHAKAEREKHERLVRELNFSPSPEPDEEKEEDTLNAKENFSHKRHKRRPVRKLNLSPSPEPDEEEDYESDEEEEDDYLNAKEERARHERLLRELGFSPSPEPDEGGVPGGMTDIEKENARIEKYRRLQPHLSESLLRCMDKQVMKGKKMREHHLYKEKLRQLEIKEIRQRIREAKKAGIKKEDLPPWEVEMPAPPPKSALSKIIKDTRKHTKKWRQAQECLNAPRKRRPKQKPEPPKPTDGTFHYPEKHLHTSWFSYNYKKLGDSTHLSYQDFDRPFIASGLKRTRNIMTKCNFPRPIFRRRR
ncbi:hypothetical protein AA313_de0209245 [Arthrobotrys entomopaga]|nr:hypothetical protein AA313_de0209245 [Arthrobotrys entomopaga]